MTRLWYLLLLLLLVSVVSLAASEEDEEEDSSTEASKEDTDQRATVTVTKDICLDARVLEKESPLNHCCETHYDLDQETIDCMNRIETEKKKTNDKFVVLSRLAECIYIKKKFTKGTENLNFKRIKAAADKLENPREGKFIMDMYKRCSNKAKEDLKVIKLDTKPGKLPLGVRRPFYSLVFICVTSYSKTHSCPYFRWQNLSEKKGNDCTEYISECKKLLKE